MVTVSETRGPGRRRGARLGVSEPAWSPSNQRGHCCREWEQSWSLREWESCQPLVPTRSHVFTLWKLGGTGWLG